MPVHAVVLCTSVTMARCHHQEHREWTHREYEERERGEDEPRREGEDASEHDCDPEEHLPVEADAKD